MKRVLRVVVALTIPLLAIRSSLAAQTRQPITFETFLALQISGDPQVSADGSMAAFTVSVPSLGENRNVSRIWVVPTAGGAARAVTAGPGSDLAPRWAPDGKSLAFISTRNAGPQVWRVALAGGDPAQVTSVESGVNDFFWAPDGGALYLTSDIKWPAGQHEIDRRTGPFPTQAKIWTDLFYRHWNEWRVGTRSHLFRLDLATKALTDLTPIDRDVPTLALGGADLAVSAAGDLAVVYNPDQDIAESTNNDLFLIGAGGGAPEPVTTRRGNDHSPAFSPDGKSIAYLSMATPGFESDHQQLWLYDRATKQHRSLTGNWDRNVQSAAWTSDSKSLVVEIEERGYHNLYTLELATGRRRLIVSGGVNSTPRVTAKGDVVFLRQTATLPPELFAAGLDGSRLRSLAPLNSAALATLDLPPLESFSFKGALGDSVQGWLLKPPGFDPAKKYPLFYVVHGGPQVPMSDAWSARWNYQMFASRGYVVGVVNFHGSPGWGQAFTNSISKHWGDYPFEDLMKGLDVIAALPFVDSARMGAAGASYGGYMINWMQGHTDRFKAFVSHDGIFNLASAQGATEELWFPNHEFGEGGVTNPETRAMLDKWSPHQFAERWKTPMLLVHGQQDYRLDLSEGLQAFTALRVRGIQGKFLYFPDEGHWVLKPRNRRLWWSTVLDWMDQYLRPGAANSTP
ncbi:MAG: S9 family peptidase [Gemmatimonadales bacterium]|nr:S9 family peptidase [Gemmatimonadales bacterium]